MLCFNCKTKEATTHIHSVVNGVVKDMYLCSECSAKMHQKTFIHDNFFDLMSSFLSAEKPMVSDSVKCSCCGTSFDTISKSGRVGCGNCYKTFEKLLEPALVRLHGKTSHIGKRVLITKNEEETKTTSNNDKESVINKLQSELGVAVKNEEFDRKMVAFC